MASAGDVLAMLLPDGGWVTRGNDYESIEWISCEPISKEAFEAGFAQYDAWKAEQETTKAADKAALLQRLGITADEAALLLGGN
jgi:hypothetical protein